MDLATVDKLLTTTRSVRQRLDLTRPVDPAVIQECLEIATQAPTGGNICRYHFVVVTDPSKRAGLAHLYRKQFYERYTPERLAEMGASPRDVASWFYLANHLHEVPVHVITCCDAAGRRDARTRGMADILPATWSLMLALRARGIGAAWTTTHTRYELEAAELLGIPQNIVQAVLLAVAYFTGEDFRPAKRVPARERTYWDTWGQTR